MPKDIVAAGAQPHTPPPQLDCDAWQIFEDYRENSAGRNLAAARDVALPKVDTKDKSGEFFR